MTNLTAYKDITPEQMTILARAIVDQNETPDQASCLYCHQNTESYKKNSVILQLILRLNLACIKNLFGQGN